MRSTARPRSAATAAALVFAFLARCPPAQALNPALDVSQYAHTAWTIRGGFLTAGVTSIAQTPDGYLWIGTASGLLRFDGVRTVPWSAAPLPDNEITRLLVTRDGRLWIGTGAGLASWNGNRVITYSELAGARVSALVEDSEGTVWAGTQILPNASLCAIRSAVTCVGQDGIFGSAVTSLFADQDDLWVGSIIGLWHWKPGIPVKYDMPSPNTSDLMKVKEGSLLIAAPGGLRRLVGNKSEIHPLPGVAKAFDAVRLLLDRDAGQWIGTHDRGLVHVHDGRTDFFTRADGLSGDAIQALYQDREGTIWVGTVEGLDRFRELPVALASRAQGLPSDLVLSVLAGRDGSAWVGTTDGLMRSKGGQTTTYRRRDGLPDDHIETLFEDRAGRILVATLEGLAAFDGSRFVPLPRVPTRVVYDIVEERPGDLWISEQEQGLLHVVGDDLVDRIPWSAFRHEDHATAMAADRTKGGLWLGFYKGGLSFVKDGAVREAYATEHGLGAGRVSDLRFDRDGVLWAATGAGLSRIKDNHIATLTTRNGLPCATVHWSIEDEHRAVWLLLSCGLVRLEASEVAAWVGDPRRAVKTVVFDSADGVRSEAIPIGFSPPAAMQSGGQLWFATTSGVGVVNSNRLPFNSVSPPVRIEQILADRNAFEATTEATGPIRLPPRLHDLQIHYTGLSLVAAEKMRFRYKLEGIDRDWQEVGNRRQAFYTDLPPRQYRFRVTASNNDGVWNDAGATLDFTILPAYYQTDWFVALSAVLIGAALLGAHRLRLRFVEKHEREIIALNERLMKAQEQERIRIAGELHDGVMQQMLAVTMMLGTAKRRIPQESEARGTLDKIQEKLLQVGTDIRQLSHDLHPPVLQDAGLAEAVRACCEDFSTASGISVACKADEAVGRLSRGAALALFRILQEALGNAAKYSHAKHITVRLAHSTELITLVVSDDGVGFDRNQLVTSGGLGLITMRERAGQLSGRFEFDTAPGQGTTIRVLIPFR